MPERICDSYGKKKSVQGGKICERGHPVLLFTENLDRQLCVRSGASSPIGT